MKPNKYDLPHFWNKNFLQLSRYFHLYAGLWGGGGYSLPTSTFQQVNNSLTQKILTWSPPISEGEGGGGFSQINQPQVYSSAAKGFIGILFYYFFYFVTWRQNIGGWADRSVDYCGLWGKCRPWHRQTDRGSSQCKQQSLRMHRYPVLRLVKYVDVNNVTAWKYRVKAGTALHETFSLSACLSNVFISSNHCKSHGHR